MTDKMNIGVVGIVSLTVVLALCAGAASVFAESNNGTTTGQQKKEEKTEGKPVPTLYGNSTTTASSTNHVTPTDTATTTTPPKEEKENNGKGGEMSALHRSAVATFVQNLKAIGQKDGGIGQEVSAVAKEQEDTADEDEAAIASIETRSTLKTFFLGTDYKSVGVLRSSLTTTENHITRLEAARDKATNVAVKAELQVEIDALKAEKTELETFVDANESKLSVLGWLVKMFQ